MLQLLGYLPQLLLIQSILHHLPFEYLRLSASSSQYFSFCLDRSLVLPKDKHSTSISSLQAASAGLAISQVDNSPCPFHRSLVLPTPLYLLPYRIIYVYYIIVTWQSGVAMP